MSPTGWRGCLAVGVALTGSLLPAISERAPAKPVRDKSAANRTLTAVPGIHVGHHTLTERPTGCTVIIVENGVVAGVDVRGGAPGTRETSLLDPVNAADRIYAVALAGGSAYGLDAASGVMRYLDERNIGFKFDGTINVPIVPAAVLIDLAVGGKPKVRPTADCGYAAAQAASDAPVAEGNVGAGAGATIGKFAGYDRAMKGGLGSAAITLPDGTIVAALVAVNALGDVIDPATGHVVAGCRTPDGSALADARVLLRSGETPPTPSAGSTTGGHDNTTLGVIATNVTLTKADATKVAQMAHDGFARAIAPIHTPRDGDTIFALATGEVTGNGNVLRIGALAADVVAEAVVRAAREATSIPGYPAARDLHAQQGPRASAHDLLKDPAVRTALAYAKAHEAETIENQIRFCQVPAPAFKETARAELLKQVFQEIGLQNIRIDKAGNLLGDRPGAATRPHFVIAAHLDTVFPEGTDVKVKRDGNVLRGPGIGDDCRGLAVLVMIARSLKEANVRTPGSITFVANVGEEGLGDLRGMKQLFSDTLKDQIDRFVSIDGSGLSLTRIAVGSYRYRVTFKGPGGHSFGAFGLANPIDALGRAIAKIADFQVPKTPKTTFNVGRVGGGTSVNSIPFEGWMEVDMRSSDPASLAAVDSSFQKAVDSAVVEENTRWGKPGMITVTRQRVGDRPAGSTAADAPIVQAAIAATTALGFPAPTPGEGSTDANVPMSLRVPAITIGGGGRGTGEHSLEEAFDTTDSWHGTQRALLLTIALSQK